MTKFRDVIPSAKQRHEIITSMKKNSVIRVKNGFVILQIGKVKKVIRAGDKR